MITKIELDPKLAAYVGLTPVTLDRLGKLVLLVGPNGGGKTRSLKLVRDSLPPRRELTFLGRSEPPPDGIRCSRSVESENVVMLEYDLSQTVVKAADAAPSTFRDLVVRNRKHIDFGEAHATVDVSLTHAARILYAAEHPKSSSTIAAELRRVNALDLLVQALLGTPITYELSDTGDPQPMLFGRPFVPGHLSRGQHVLLCWAHLLSQQHEELSSSIIFFDEPELHLHPDVCWRAISRLLTDVIGEHGQIWLATHSLPLVASACAVHGIESLYYVDKGKIDYAGNRIETVLGGLLGGEPQRETLHTFLGEADSLAFHTFAAGCLVAPEPVAGRDGDPQSAQVTGLINERVAAGQPISILDYAAGRGRLAAATAHMLARVPEAQRRLVSYATYHDLGFSPAAELADARAALASLSSLGVTTRAYTDRGGEGSEELRALKIAERKPDLILLVNTLHEIPIPRWQRVFDDLAAVTAPDGHVLIVEDQKPPMGELPHADGFVILDRLELQRLFRLDQLAPLPGTSDRLTAFLIPASALARVNAESIHAALALVKERAMREIARLRTRGDTSMRAGREHALHAMMWVNAQLVLDSLPRPASIAADRVT